MLQSFQQVQNMASEDNINTTLNIHQASSNQQPNVLIPSVTGDFKQCDTQGSENLSKLSSSDNDMDDDNSNVDSLEDFCGLSTTKQVSLLIPNFPSGDHNGQFQKITIKQPLSGENLSKRRITHGMTAQDLANAFSGEVVIVSSKTKN